MNSEIYIVPENGRFFLKDSKGNLVGTKKQRSHGFKTWQSASAVRHFRLNAREAMLNEYKVRREMGYYDRHLDNI